LRAAFAVTALFLRRYLPNPMNIGATLFLPIVIALIFGTADARAESELPIGIVHDDSPTAVAYADALDSEPGVRLLTFGSRAALVTAVRRADVVAGVVVPPTGLSVEMIGTDADPLMKAARAVVASVAYRERVSLTTAPRVDVVELPDTEHGRATGLARAAAGMLVYCLFVNVMHTATFIAEDRKRGVYRRMGAAPASAAAVVTGEVLGRVGIGVMQCLVVALASALLFGTEWGAPVAFLLVVVALSLVASGAAVLLGVGVRRAGPQVAIAGAAIAAFLGLVGGCFWSLDIVPHAMRTIGFITPTAWALDAFDGLIARGEDLLDIGLQLAVLAGFTGVLLWLASARLRSTLGNVEAMS
jgi:ABC-2 type transport system permease protein